MSEIIHVDKDFINELMEALKIMIDQKFTDLENRFKIDSTED